MKNYLHEVESRLRALGAKNQAGKWKAEDYIGGGLSKLEYLNLKITGSTTGDIRMN